MLNHEPKRHCRLTAESVKVSMSLRTVAIMYDDVVGRGFDFDNHDVYTSPPSTHGGVAVRGP